MSGLEKYVFSFPLMTTATSPSQRARSSSMPHSDIQSRTLETFLAKSRDELLECKCLAFFPPTSPPPPPPAPPNPSGNRLASPWQRSRFCPPLQRPPFLVSLWGNAAGIAIEGSFAVQAKSGCFHHLKQGYVFSSSEEVFRR